MTISSDSITGAIEPTITSDTLQVILLLIIWTTSLSENKKYLTLTKFLLSHNAWGTSSQRISKNITMH